MSALSKLWSILPLKSSMLKNNVLDVKEYPSKSGCSRCGKTIFPLTETEIIGKIKAKEYILPKIKPFHFCGNIDFLKRGFLTLTSGTSSIFQICLHASVDDI